MSESPVSFLDTPEIRRKSELIGAIIEALAHFPRERAMEIVMAWMTVEDLEHAAPTICRRKI